MSKLEPYHNKCHLPVWVNGNAYFNGAKACVNEKENLMDNENQVKVELVEKDGHYSIKTNVYEFLKDFRTGIINSNILGYAFEPEQRFEDPDGSTIIFDQDYLGEHRSVAAISFAAFLTATSFLMLSFSASPMNPLISSSFIWY